MVVGDIEANTFMKFSKQLLLNLLISINIVLLILILSLTYYFDIPSIISPEANDTISLSVDNSSINSKQNLQIISEATEKAIFSHIHPEDLNGNFSNSIKYWGLRNVSIIINENIVALDEAIQLGYISVEEMWCAARLDAKQGFCDESFVSKNGLTTFSYQYPEHTLVIVYDVYETPDGSQYLIEDFALCKPGIEYKQIYTDTNGNILDKEDWGLAFEVSSTNNEELELIISQTKCQQLGKLAIQYYYILTSDGNSLPNINRSNTYLQIPNPPEIVLDNQTKINLNWVNTYGSLPTGSYILVLQIVDHYNNTEVPSLMKNYHDQQIYKINFTIS